jgi:hypothetical protein
MGRISFAAFPVMVVIGPPSRGLSPRARPPQERKKRGRGPERGGGVKKVKGVDGEKKMCGSSHGRGV